MGELETKDRKRIPRGEYAYVDSEGNEKLPLNDESHIRNAMSRWSRTHFESKSAKERARKKIVAAAHKAGIDVSSDDKVAHPVK